MAARRGGGAPAPPPVNERKVARGADATIAQSWLEYPTGIPVEAWGKDHLSTLLYAETRAVDHRGWLPYDDPHMRADGHSYPTRLHNGVEVHGHSDWECLKDAEAAGFLTYDEDGMPDGISETPRRHGSIRGSGPGLVSFTDDGWTFVHSLRRKRGEAAAR